MLLYTYVKGSYSYFPLSSINTFIWIGSKNEVMGQEVNLGHQGSSGGGGTAQELGGQILPLWHAPGCQEISGGTEVGREASKVCVCCVCEGMLSVGEKLNLLYSFVSGFRLLGTNNLLGGSSLFFIPKIFE